MFWLNLESLWGFALITLCAHSQVLYVTGSILFLAGTALFTPDVPLSAAPKPGPLAFDFQFGSFGTLLWGQQYYITGGALPSPPDSSLFLGE